MSTGFRRRHVLQQAIASASLAAAELAVGLLCARALGADGLGQLAAAFALATVVFALIDLRLQEATIVIGAALAAEGQPSERATILRRLLILDFGTGLLGFVAVAAIAAAAPMLPQALAMAPALLLAAGAAVLVKNAGCAVCRAYLRMTDRYAVLAALTGTGAVTRVAAIVPAVVGSREADVPDILLLVLLGNAAAGAILVIPTVAIAVLRDGIGASGEPARAETSHRMSRFVRGSWLQSLALAPLREMDIVILAAFAGDSAVGAYRLARTGLQGIDALLSPIHLVVFPHVARLLAQDETARLAVFLRRLTIRLALAGVAVAAVGAMAAPKVIEAVAGPTFGSSVPLLQAILMLAPLVAATVWAGPLLVAAGATHRAAAATAAAGIASVAVTAVASAAAGAWGPVAGYAAFVAVNAAASILAARRDPALGPLLGAVLRPAS